MQLAHEALRPTSSYVVAIGWARLSGRYAADPYFLADSGATNAVDLNIIPNSWAGHERFPVI